MPKDFYIIHADGGTPIAGTVLWAGSATALRREERKDHRSSLSDGEPGRFSPCQKASEKRVNRYGMKFTPWR